MAPSPASLVPAHVSPPARAGAALALALAFGAGLAGGLLARAPAVSHADPCALPGGLDLGALGAADRSWIAHRAIACSDRAHGRIGAAEYRATIAALDAAPPAPPPPPPAIAWAATVRGVSSQWSTDTWSAARVLGPPEVYPASGDDSHAWASRGADDQVEWIEVGLAAPHRLSAVQIFETLNPGAVTRVELITTRGERRVAYAGAAAIAGTAANLRTLDFACTAEPIAAIRVTLDSPAVPGWNELDAIGGQPV